jgi:hypothetical protein
MAIVLAIMGVILAGVLKGQELLENARLKGLMTQINQYRLAVITFQEKYGALPGDFAKAKAYIDNALKDGQGNGTIDGPGLSNGGGSDHEALSFWAHMSAAHLIPSVGTVHGDRGSFDQGAPSCAFGGGVTVCHAPFEDMPGHWFVLGKANGMQGNGALLTPQQALSLSLRFDTADPRQGQIRVKNGQGAQGGACLKDDGTFQLNTKAAACVVYVAF